MQIKEKLWKPCAEICLYLVVLYRQLLNADPTPDFFDHSIAVAAFAMPPFILFGIVKRWRD